MDNNIFSNTYFIDFGDLFCNLVDTLKDYNIKIDSVSYSLIDEYATLLDSVFKERKLNVRFMLENTDIEWFLNANRNNYKEATDSGSINVLNNDEEITVLHQVLAAPILEIIYDEDIRKRVIGLYAKSVCEDVNQEFSYAKKLRKNITTNE